MKQLIHILVAAIAMTISASAYAQETVSGGISQSDLQQLQQLACTGNNSEPQLQASLDDLESTLTQALTAYGIELTAEQLQSAYNKTTQVLAQLEAENTVQQFCAGY